ncbi:MAG: RelE-like toxin of type toxin-antitoxin system HigB [Candidatus Acidoferrum typicum]|jgi:plasmid maintenance system killer protein|nr:RelE-like toxin of type toxin-antitoxin system HigB [Candidatus Acidoferrum typicum]
MKKGGGQPQLLKRRKFNDQWRVWFVWHENDAHQVEIVDYH